jgi:hypothetical protein
MFFILKNERRKKDDKTKDVNDNLVLVMVNKIYKFIISRHSHKAVRYALT